VPRGGLLQGGSRRHGVLQGAWRRQAVPRGGLPKVCSRRHATLRGAWRRQALPARGLPQGSCYRRHVALFPAWRGQTVPREGLHQGSCCRQHRALHSAWRRQALPARGLHQGGSRRRHASLQGAWRRRALPSGGLLQTSRSSSRQCVLQTLSTGCAARRCDGGRTRSSSLVMRRRLKPRFGSRATCEDSRRAGGRWRVRRSPQASERKWQTCSRMYIHIDAHEVVLRARKAHGFDLSQGGWHQSCRGGE
jgi:hypothetical protein